MFWKWSCLLLLLLLLVVMPYQASRAYAASDEVDPYNTYQWNRESAQSGSRRSDTGNWYEWWYYKVIDPATSEAFLFTYGVINPWDVQGGRSFLQFGSFGEMSFYEQNFPLSDFSAQYDRVRVDISSNRATDRFISGQVTDKKGRRIRWNLEFEKDWAFNAMGWGLQVSGISGIYWYPAQASAHASGWIEIDKRRIYLERAPSYQDRNWGRTFPKWWAWLVSNHFEGSPGTVLAAGGGKPKIFNSFYWLTGLCVGFRHKEREYIFRSTDGHRVKFDIHWGRWELAAENNKGERIEISASASSDKFLLLPFQTPQGSLFYDYEALLGNIQVSLYKRASFIQGWKKIAEVSTSAGGIEWGSPEPIPPQNLEFQFDSHLDPNF